MLRLYLNVKVISILIIIAIILKILTKISPFDKYDYNIRRAKKSGILSLIVISIYIIIGIVYLVILKKYFMNYPTKDIIFMQSAEYLFELSLVIAIVILTKEGIASLSLTKNNVFKSIIVGILSGIIYFVLIIVFLGLLLGYIRMKTKSIIAGSIFHAIFNWSGAIMYIVR